MEIQFIAGVAVLGLIVGSFWNAVIYRLHAKKPGLLGGRSSCPSCGKTLAARDLIPLVSFLILRGRCRFCGKKIGAYYFWVELVTAAVFAITAFVIGADNLGLLGWNLFFVAVLILIAAYDWQHGEIPDEVSLPALGVALGGSFLLPLTLDWTASFLGILVGGGFFFALVAISRGRWMGGGDIRLGALLGALLGAAHFAVALLLASLLGSLVGLALVARRKKKLGSAVPFAPFLAAGGISALLWGETIWGWYISQFLG